jgi:hypothetical protein
MSSIDRVIGPMASNRAEKGTSPAVNIVPGVGFVVRGSLAD